MGFKGYCDTEVVLSWATHWLIPAREAGDTVIGDNASVHQSQKLADAIKIRREKETLAACRFHRIVYVSRLMEARLVNNKHHPWY